MSEKWKKCLNISVCKSYGFTFEREINEYIDYFNDCSDEKYCYCKVYEYLGDIEQAVTIRNRLAHGQWKIQLNSNEKLEFISSEHPERMWKFRKKHHRT